MSTARAQILSQQPDPARPYMYRGTNVFVNKFGILHAEALENVVRSVSWLRVELLRLQPIAGQFDFEHLRAVHRYLFQDIYDWAGELRVCDIEHSKEQSYAPAAAIAHEAKRVFAEFKAERRLEGLAWPEFLPRAAYYFARLMYVHTFRDGNGRSLRSFFEQLAAERGWRIDLHAVPGPIMVPACQAGRHGNLDPLYAVFGQALELVRGGQQRNHS